MDEVKELASELTKLRKEFESELSKEKDWKEEVDRLKEQLELQAKTKDEEFAKEIDKLKEDFRKSMAVENTSSKEKDEMMFAELNNVKKQLGTKQVSVSSPKLSLPTLPLFSGEGDQDIIEWVQRFQAATAVSHATSEMKNDLITVYTTGYARVVLERFLSSSEQKQLIERGEHDDAS